MKFPKEAYEHCAKEKCGHCLDHEPPFTCCAKMGSLLLELEGLEWCKHNIKYFDDFGLEKPKIEYKDYIQGKLF